MCSLVGGTSGKERYDPVQWLSTRKIIGMYKLERKNKESVLYGKIAAPDAALDVQIEKKWPIFGRKAKVQIDVDAIWCSDKHCSSMLDMIIDRDSGKLNVLLQMYNGTYFGVSAAGSYVNYFTPTKTVSMQMPSVYKNIDMTLYNYVPNKSYNYTRYHAADAFIASNSIMRSLVAANIQGSFAVKTIYIKMCGECTRVLYSGNPCTGFPLFGNNTCSDPTSLVLIVPSNKTNLSKSYKEATSKARIETEKGCDSYNSCNIFNAGHCLSTVCNETSSLLKWPCKNGVWNVSLYNAGQVVGTGTAVSLKDRLWQFKTSDVRNTQWKTMMRKKAQSIAKTTSEVFAEGYPVKGIVPSDYRGLYLLKAMRNYPNLCDMLYNTDLLSEINYLGTYYNCSTSTTDDTYESLLSKKEYTKCVPSENTKYEYYSNAKMVDYASAIALYDYTVAVVPSNASNCIRLNTNPPSRFCQNEGEQYLVQLVEHMKKTAMDEMTIILASASPTLSTWAMIVASILSIIGMYIAPYAVFKNYITSEPDSSLSEEEELISHGKLRMLKWKEIVADSKLYSDIKFSMFTLALAEVALFAPFFVDAAACNTNSNAGYSRITANSIANDRYDSGFIYILSNISGDITCGYTRRFVVSVILTIAGLTAFVVVNPVVVKFFPEVPEWVYMERYKKEARKKLQERSVQMSPTGG